MYVSSMSHMSHSGAVVLLYVPAVCGINLYYTNRIHMIPLICHPVFVCHIPQSDSDIFGSVSLSVWHSVQFNSIQMKLIYLKDIYFEYLSTIDTFFLQKQSMILTGNMQ